jgi:hypothetical protein
MHPVAPVFNENHQSITFVRDLFRLYCTQYNTTLHVSHVVLSQHSRLPAYTLRRKTVHQMVKEPRIFEKRHLNEIFILYANLIKHIVAITSARNMTRNTEADDTIRG